MKLRGITLLLVSTPGITRVGKACPATDQRGQPRKTDGCAAGAVEVP